MVNGHTLRSTAPLIVSTPNQAKSLRCPEADRDSGDGIEQVFSGEGESVKAIVQDTYG